MVRVVTTTAGFFPGWSRGGPPDVLSLQRQAGLDRLVTGQQDWVGWLAEPLRRQPAVSRVPAVETGDDTQPGYVRTGAFQSTGILSPEIDGRMDRFQVVLPGPYTLSTMLDDRRARDDGESVADIVRWLRHEIDECPAHRSVLILEPALVKQPPPSDIVEILPNQLDRLVKPLSDPVVYPWGGSVSPKTYAYLMDANLHAIGYDIIADSPGAIELIAEFGSPDAVALGCLDAIAGIGMSAPIITERLETIRSRSRMAAVDHLYVLPNRPLATLPVGTIQPLLEELGAVDRELPA